MIRADSMKANDTTTDAGRCAEEQAARHLAGCGLAIIARNFRCRGGEIDLICRDRHILVFVEVRFRRTRSFGGAAASITLSKQRRIILAARHYLASQGAYDADCRFDCVVFDGPHLEWIRNAFSAD